MPLKSLSLVLSMLRLRGARLLVATLLLPAAAFAQITYTGTSANQNFGSVAVNSTSAAQTFSFSVAAGTTVGSIGVMTQGVAALDFARASGGTCTATSYVSAATCTVKITFKPAYAGTRSGAIVFFSGASSIGTVLGSVFVTGTGSGPQIVYGPVVPDIGLGGVASAAIDPGVNGVALNSPMGVAVDGAGTLYVADELNYRVVKIPRIGSDSTAIEALGGSQQVWGVAVDGAGDLFYSEPLTGQVIEVPTGGGAAITIAPTVDSLALSHPTGLAVDTAGDLFIADTFNNRVVEIPAGGGTPVAISPSVGTVATNHVQSVAVDGPGNLYLADYNNNRVVEVPAGGGTAIVVPGLSGTDQSIVAVDGAGDLFVNQNSSASTAGYFWYEVPVGGGAVTVLNPQAGQYPNGFTAGLALDSAGNLYFSSVSSAPGSGTDIWSVVEAERAQAPFFEFQTPTPEYFVDTTDGTQTSQIVNAGNQPLDITALSFNSNFPEASGDTSACTAPMTLSPGHACDVPIEFAPQVAPQGSDSNVTGDAVLTDNALNVAGTQQSIYTYGHTLQPETEFLVTGPASVVQDVPFVVTVTYYVNGKAANYSGPVNLSSTDPDFSYGPNPVQLVDGVGQATVILGTPGDQSIDVDIPNDPSVSGGGSFPVVPLSSLGTVTYTGSAASANFGSLAVGTASAAQTYSFSLTAGMTIGSIEVVTQGAPNLDFTSASGGTCTATTYVSATTCTVKVTFAPMYAGMRLGAIVFYYGAGNSGPILGSLPISGVGTGPQVAFSPIAATSIDPTVDSLGLRNPLQLIADAAGEIFVVDQQNNRVLKLPAGGGAAIDIFDQNSVSGADFFPSGLALDGAGNLYIADGAGHVEKVPANGDGFSYVNTLTNQTNLQLMSVAVDAVGDLYIGYAGTPSVIVEVLANGAGGTEIIPAMTVLGSGVPRSLALDGAGDLFIADSLANRVIEAPAGGGAATSIDPSVNGIKLKMPSSVAVDGAGDLYISDNGNNRIVEIPAGGGSPILSQPSGKVLNISSNYSGVAVDSAGNLFIADASNNRIIEERRSQAPSLSYATPTGIGAVDKADGTQSVAIQNIGNAPLVLSAVSFPADFTASTVYSNECAPGSMAPGAQCALNVNFTPENTGPLSEDVMVTDNALNVSGAQQAIDVSGTGLSDQAATLTSPTPGSTLSGSSVTFSWSGGVGVQQYQLIVGTWGVGAGNIFNSYYIPSTQTSITVPIPADGVTLHVRLVQELNGVFQTADYTYTESGASAAAVISSPANGSTLGSTNVTFSWPGGKGAYEYQLKVGTTGPGSSNVYSSPGLFTTSQTVTVPANGATLYVSFAQQLNGVWQGASYTYTEPGSPTPAAVTSPAPGSTLTGTTVTFNWAGGAGPTAYQFLVGVNGPGSGSLLNTFQTHATSATVTIPANGKRIYVRLNQEINGVWTSTDYTYTEAGS